MTHLLPNRGMRSWRCLAIVAVLSLSACESNAPPSAQALLSSANVSVPVLSFPFPGLWPPSKSSGPTGPVLPLPPNFPWSPQPPAPPPPNTTCNPACSGGQVCTNGACVCPHPGDVMCLKGFSGLACTNPKTDNFACGCVQGGSGSVCTIGSECCGGKCTTCPAGQTVDPLTCGCKGTGTGTGAAEQPTLWLLTNSSNGTYFGLESTLKTRTRCSFSGGGINCKPTDLVTYKKLMEPQGSVQKSQEYACANFTKRYNHPLGIGWKALWKPTNERYGLWDSTVDFLHKCVPDGL